MKVSVLGIDLGKNVFHVYGIDERGQPIVRKKLTRHKLQAFMANLDLAWSGWRRVGARTIGHARFSSLVMKSV